MKNLSLILSILPSLIAAIKAIEEAIPGAGKGEQKLAAIRSVMEAADSTVASVWPTVEKVITTLVGLFNATGVFKKA